MTDQHGIRGADESDLPRVAELISPGVACGELLSRTSEELHRLLPHMMLLVDRSDGDRVRGCAAIEIYSHKFSEVQCLATDLPDDAFRTKALAALIDACVQRAVEQEVLEIMAVTSETVAHQRCGFDVILPGQKVPLFVEPVAALATKTEADLEPDPTTIRLATTDDLPALAELTAPFVIQKKLLPRTEFAMRQLFASGFVAESDGRVVGCCALEIYSPRLGEVQCLAVDSSQRGRGLGRILVRRCLKLAAEANVREVLAISASENFLRSCGFGLSAPGQRQALFCQTREL